MKLIPIKRKVGYASSSWATNTWTLNFGAVHYFATNDYLVFQDPVTTTDYRVQVTVSDSDTVTFSSTNNLITFPSFFYLDVFGTGATGAQDTFTTQFSNDTYNGLIHVVSNGTATVTAKAQGSLDQTHWVDHGTATAVTAGSQLEIPVTKPYPYMRLNFTVAVGSAGGGANTIKAYRAGC